MEFENSIQNSKWNKHSVDDEKMGEGIQIGKILSNVAYNINK